MGGTTHDDLVETADVDEARVTPLPHFKSLLMRDSLLPQLDNKTGFMQRTFMILSKRADI